MARASSLLKPIVSELQGEAAFAYLAKAKRLEAEGRDVISFAIGQPDTPVPGHVIEAAKEALDEGFTGYTETPGIPELRGAIADYLNERYGSDVRPDEILVTTGAKAAIFLAIASFLGPGDEIVVPEPSFPAYPEVARLFGARPVYVPLKLRSPARGFELDVEGIERALSPRTKMVVVNNPHNPTGALFPPDQVDEIMDLARRRGFLVLADEIYDNFVYGPAFKSFLSHEDWRDHVVYVNGLSKTFSMTGWRLGYLVLGGELASRVARLAVNVYSCAVSFAQKAAVRALRGPWEPVRRNLELFRERRDAVVRELSSVPGFEVPVPHGAFYVFPRVAKLLSEAGVTAEGLVDYLLYEVAVATLPGSVFPDKAGRQHLRLSFAVSVDRIREGVRRIRDAVERLLNEGPGPLRRGRDARG